MYGNLKSASYSESGDMIGSLYAIDALRDDDGAPIVQLRKSEAHHLPIEVSEYRADADLFDRIDAIVDGVGMKEWGEVPMSEFIALDAATESLSLYYDSTDPENPWLPSLRYTFNEVLPEGGKDAIKEIRELMESYVSDDRLIRSYTEGD